MWSIPEMTVRYPFPPAAPTPGPVNICSPAGVTMRKSVWRGIIEIAFIVFLFYSNLLMGEFERSGAGQRRGLTWALTDVFTTANFAIALTAAFAGYVLFEFLRKRF